MSNNQMVSVPRELTPEMRQAFHSSYEAYEEGRGECPDSQWRAMLRSAPKPAAQRQVEPVLHYKALKGHEAKPTGECYSVFFVPMPGHAPLYTHADPAEVERLHAEIKEWESIFDMQEGKIDTLRAQLAEVHALLRELINDEDGLLAVAEISTGFAWHALQKHGKRVDAALSASAERNQCDGCQAGIPVVNGAHRMGKPGGYSDSMACQAVKYASAEPSAPVEIDERAAFDAYCTKVGLPLDRLPTGDYLIPATRFVSQGWHAHAAASRKQ